MRERLIILEVPVISEHYELFVPIDMKIKKLKILLANAVSEITNGQYISSGTEVLCLKEQNLQLSEEREIQQYGIENGDTIYLI